MVCEGTTQRRRVQSGVCYTGPTVQGQPTAVEPCPTAIRLQLLQTTSRDLGLQNNKGFSSRAVEGTRPRGVQGHKSRERGPSTETCTPYNPQQLCGPAWSRASLGDCGPTTNLQAMARQQVMVAGQGRQESSHKGAASETVPPDQDNGAYAPRLPR